MKKRTLKPLTWYTAPYWEKRTNLINDAINALGNNFTYKTGRTEGTYILEEKHTTACNMLGLLLDKIIRDGLKPTIETSILKIEYSARWGIGIIKITLE